MPCPLADKELVRKLSNWLRLYLWGLRNNEAFDSVCVLAGQWQRSVPVNAVLAFAMASKSKMALASEQRGRSASTWRSFSTGFGGELAPRPRHSPRWVGSYPTLRQRRRLDPRRLPPVPEFQQPSRSVEPDRFQTLWTPSDHPKIRRLLATLHRCFRQAELS